MDNTISAMPLRSALALVLAALIAVTAFAAQDDIPRTASGTPDLSGFYDVATLTPLSRPAKFGDNLFLTEEQARAIEEEDLAFLAKANEQSDPNRAAPSDDGAAPVGFEDSQREDLGAGTSVGTMWPTRSFVDIKPGTRSTSTGSRASSTRRTASFTGWPTRNWGTRGACAPPASVGGSTKAGGRSSRASSTFRCLSLCRLAYSSHAVPRVVRDEPLHWRSGCPRVRSGCTRTGAPFYCAFSADSSDRRKTRPSRMTMSIASKAEASFIGVFRHK